MYKVLLVDDERVILDGISKIVNWSGVGTELIGTARNGIEAYEFIMLHQPDIVITDILMPGMDGLQLIEKTREHNLPVQFIMLSGFSDFDYARQAIRYGVKEYLLKPCNEASIEKAITDLIRDMDRLKSKEQFMERLQVELRQVLPHAKEQLFKEFVTNKTYGRRDLAQYGDLLGIPSEQMTVRLIVIEPEGRHEFEHLFALKNIAQDIFGKDILLLSTTIGSQVILMVKDALQKEHLYRHIEEMKCTFYDFYKLDTSIALSDADHIKHARSMYKDALACLNHRFYLAEGGLITKQDIVDAAGGKGTDTDIGFDEERLGLLLKAGRSKDVRELINDFFERLSSMRLDAAMAKTYVITLYLSIMRHEPERIKRMMEEIERLNHIQTLSGLQEVVTETALAISEKHYESNRSKHSAIIRKVLDIIHQHLSDPELTLSSVASEMLYMNPDYLGKLFKKETGEKFSNYVMKLRMEKAIEMIMDTSDVKIFEIAESLGYGDNPQYFSKVFKKYTGMTPSEFKSG